MPAHDRPPPPLLRKKHTGRLRVIGVVFVALGGLAVFLPGWATVAAEKLIAWAVVLWGLAGLGFAWSLRSAPEWRYAAVLFAAVFAAGTLLVAFPGAGVSVLTMLVVLIFLLEGILSVIAGLRDSGRSKSGWWLVFSGACALVVGLVVLLGWPETSIWLLGLLLGLNFLSSGSALIALSLAAGV